MKIAAENRNKLIAAAVLGGLALVLIARAFFSFGGDSSPSTPVASAVVPAVSAPHGKPAATRGKITARRPGAAPRSLDPQLRYDWLKASEDTKYEGVGRNIFKAQAEIPKPEGSGATDKKAEDEGPPPPPPPPPINLKFFGFASKPGEPKKVFLSQGEDVFIAREGEIVDRRYKVVQISPMSVEIEDEMNNHRQSIPLTQG
jgi:hypothetical protein